MNQWFLIESEKEYIEAVNRYEQIRHIEKGSPGHREKMLLAYLIQQYEQKQWTLPEADPIQIIKVRMEELGYRLTDLAKKYGDRGTLSKVLNYKQALSLNMIRIFSQFLHIPVEALTPKYKLKK